MRINVTGRIELGTSIKRCERHRNYSGESHGKDRRVLPARNKHCRELKILDERNRRVI